MTVLLKRNSVSADHCSPVFLLLQTFVIDKQGKCVMSFNDQMGAEKHVDEALQIIKTLT